MEIITRADAKVLGLARYFTGKPCKHGHVAERTVGDYTCCACSGAYYAANPEKVAAYRERTREQQAAYQRAYDRKWRAANPNKERARARAYRAANLERLRAADREEARRNRGKWNAWHAIRRARLLRATPPWLTDEHKRQIAVLYAEAARLTRETGIEHHVDHIVPLKAKRRGVREQVACGLHVPWNLRVVPGPENLSKNCYIG